MTMNATPTPVASTSNPGPLEEVQWTDDSIRWDGGLRINTSTDDPDKESSDEEDYLVDPFKDPDPFELFSFQFERPDQTDLPIRIRGFKTDADAVWQSTGLTLWRASEYLCRFQMEHPQLFRRARTLELGAGLGLNGILAWRLSAASADVCLTDGDSDALVHLRENVERNRTTAADVGGVACHQLIWGQQSAEQFLTRVAGDQKYDVLIASDIVYAAGIIEPLWDTVCTLLKPPDKDDGAGGVFIMAYARRKVPVSIEEVLDTAVDRGFAYELAKEDEKEGVWVYTFRFREGGGAE